MTVLDTIKSRIPRRIWNLGEGTIRTAVGARFTGLGAEVAYFTLLSIPPLLFGLAGLIGFLASNVDAVSVDRMTNRILELASDVLSPAFVEDVIRPTLEEVLGSGRADVVSIGFLMAIWSASRAINTVVLALTTMWGQLGERSGLKTRLISVAFLVIAFLATIVLVPLIFAGPRLLQALLPIPSWSVNLVYGLSVVVVAAAFLLSVFYFAPPQRPTFKSCLIGATATILLWIPGSFFIQIFLATVMGGTSIYGPLATPIAVLTWVFYMAMVLLACAAFTVAWVKTEQGRVPLQES